MAHQDRAQVSLEAFKAFAEQLGENQFGQLVMEIVLEELMTANKTNFNYSNENATDEEETK